MSVEYTDDEIAAFITEVKLLPSNYIHALFNFRTVNQHIESKLSVPGINGNNFVIILRKNRINSLDFSVILSIEKPQSNQVFILRRYNGKSHRHTNKIEGNRFYDFHIHEATERYQMRGMNPEGYAYLTDRYNNFEEAIFCLLNECHFKKPDDQQPELFS